MRRWEPREGEIVSFKHRGFLFGTKKPKLPLLFRVRRELTWEAVVNNWKEQKPVMPGTLAGTCGSSNSQSRCTCEEIEETAGRARFVERSRESKSVFCAISGRVGV